MFWELMQQGQIDRANWAAQDAKTMANGIQAENRWLKDRVYSLEQSVDRLTLATMALAEILRDRHGIAESEIETKIQEIDLRDGHLDGKLRVQTLSCPKCDRPNGSRRRACLYCGEPLVADSILFPGPTGPEASGS